MFNDFHWCSSIMFNDFHLIFIGFIKCPMVFTDFYRCSLISPTYREGWVHIDASGCASTQNARAAGMPDGRAQSASQRHRPRARSTPGAAARGEHRHRAPRGSAAGQHSIPKTTKFGDQGRCNETAFRRPRIAFHWCSLIVIENQWFPSIFIDFHWFP